MQQLNEELNLAWKMMCEVDVFLTELLNVCYKIAFCVYSLMISHTEPLMYYCSSTLCEKK